MKNVKNQIKGLTFIEVIGLISSLLTIVTAITTLNIFKTINKWSFEWIFGFLMQSTMYAFVISLYVAVIYFIYSSFDELKVNFGIYLYIFIIPIFLLITIFFITGLGFIDMIQFVGFE